MNINSTGSITGSRNLISPRCRHANRHSVSPLLRRPNGPHSATSTRRQANRNSPILNSRLMKAVDSWFGVSMVGLIDEPKNIGYSLLPRSAKNCFNTKEEDKCKSYRYCRYSNKVCLPSDSRNDLALVGSYINSYPSGKVYKITGKICDIEILYYGKSLKTFICLLEPIKNPNSESIIVFHVGFPVLIPFFNLSSITRLVIGEINKGKKRIILCGHSMGGIWAQQIASYLFLNNLPIQNVFVVGSGVPIWCNYDVSNFYKNRWLFFASCNDKVIDQLVGIIAQRETFPMSRLAYEKNYINKIYSQHEDLSEYRVMKTFLLEENIFFYPSLDGRSLTFNIANNNPLVKSIDLYSYNNSLHDFKFYRSQLYSLLHH